MTNMTTQIVVIGLRFVPTAGKGALERVPPIELVSGPGNTTPVDPGYVRAVLDRGLSSCGAAGLKHRRGDEVSQSSNEVMQPVRQVM